MTQPWIYKENREHVEITYAQRYRMLLYLYSLMYEANQNGIPAIRPLFLEFSGDKKCYSDNSFIFMFGESMLVASMVESETRIRAVYLPPGCRWFDMSDNLEEHSGGQTIGPPVNLGSIPIFFKGSTIYVTSEGVRHTMSGRVRRVNFLVSTDTDTSFVLCDDDGRTEDYKKGVCARTAVSVTAGNQAIIHFDTRGTYESPLEQVIIRLVSKQKDAFWITTDGERIPRYLVRDGWEETGAGWYYNLSNRTTWVKYEIPEEESYDIIISTEKFDLIGMVEE